MFNCILLSLKMICSFKKKLILIFIEIYFDSFCKYFICLYIIVHKINQTCPFKTVSLRHHSHSAIRHMCPILYICFEISNRVSLQMINGSMIFNIKVLVHVFIFSADVGDDQTTRQRQL